MVIRYVMSFVWCMVFCLQSATAGKRSVNCAQQEQQAKMAVLQQKRFERRLKLIQQEKAAEEKCKKAAVERQDVLNALLPRVQRACVAPQYEKAVAELAGLGFRLPEQADLADWQKELLEDLPNYLRHSFSVDSHPRLLNAGLALRSEWAMSVVDWNEKDAHNEQLSEDGKRLVEKMRHAHRWIESLAGVGQEWACHLKIRGLSLGRYGYEQDAAKAREFIEQQIAFGATWALHFKIKDLRGRWGRLQAREELPVDAHVVYSQDKNAARELLEQCIARGDEWALKEKIYAFDCDNAVYDYGYPRDPQAAQELIEQHVALGKVWAVSFKAWGLIDGKFAYTRDIQAARAFIEQCIACQQQDVREWGIKEKQMSLAGKNPLKSNYGYERDLDAAQALCEQYAGGVRWASYDRIRGLHGINLRRVAHGLLGNAFLVFQDLVGNFDEDSQQLERYLNLLTEFFEHLKLDLNRAASCAHGLLQ